MVRINYLPALAILVALLSPSVGRTQNLVSIPYVGGVTSRSAVILVWLQQQSSVSIEYSVREDMQGASRSPNAATSPADDNALKIELTDLTPSTRYYYRVVNEGGAPVSEVQSFRTFPDEGSNVDLNILFGSCQQSRPTDSGGVFEVDAIKDADLFVHLGDWAYPDVRVPNFPRTDSSVRASYAFRLDTSYPFARRILTRMPLAYEWDDHDAFGDNSNGTAPAAVKRRVRDAYGRYVPSYPLPNPDGIWHSFRIGNVEVFMLDSRTFRSPVDSAFDGNTFSPRPGHSMLAGGEFSIPGIDQRTWLMNAVRSSTARWKIIASQVPFNPAMAQGIVLALFIGRKDIAKRFAEYWAGYPADMDSIKALIREGHLRNTLVITGSVHTNMYDNGTHSLIPEFVAANLDIENTNLWDTLRHYNLNVWTAGQTGTESTIGRIRVETTPRHRLVVESFTEGGAKMLELVVDDQSVGSVPTDASRGRDLRLTSNGDVIVLQTDLEAGGAAIRLFTIEGRESASANVTIDDRGMTRWVLPSNLPAGKYLGRIERNGTALPFSLSR